MAAPFAERATAARRHGRTPRARTFASLGGRRIQMHVSYVNVFVRDLDRATDFYRGTLVLELQFSSPEHGYASFAAGDVRLGIALPSPGQSDLVGRHTGVGFEVADLDAEHARLSALGVRFAMPPTRQPWGAYMSLIADPDGNVFYLDQAAADRS